MVEERPQEEQVKLEEGQVSEDTGQADDVWAQLMGTTNPFINPVDEQEEAEPAGVQAPSTAQPAEDDEAAQRSFRYWQSEADKRQNKIRELEAQLTQGTQQQLPPRDPSNGQFMSPQQSEPQYAQQQAPMEFPEPPPKPQMPAGFSRIEAQSDDRSESARYLNEVDQWQGDMALYNANKIDFIEAKRQLETETMRKQQEQRERARYAQAAQQREIANLTTTLRDGYSLNDQQVAEFFTQMSDPNSISIDNLVRLYAMNKGIQLPNTQQKPVPQPSGDFKQQQRTQMVPNALGVYPSSGSAPAKSEIDRLTDEMAEMSSGSSDWL